jgi:hypothetical protein
MNTIKLPINPIIVSKPPNPGIFLGNKSDGCIMDSEGTGVGVDGLPIVGTDVGVSAGAGALVIRVGFWVDIDFLVVFVGVGVAYVLILVLGVL